MSINQDSVFRENTILIVNYCLSKYHMNWRLSPVLLKNRKFNKLISVLNSNTKTFEYYKKRRLPVIFEEHVNP